MKKNSRSAQIKCLVVSLLLMLFISACGGGGGGSAPAGNQDETVINGRA